MSLFASPKGNHSFNPNPRGVERRANGMLGRVMIEEILAWFSAAPDDGKGGGGRDPLQLALTALLVEVAHSDNDFSEAERAVIARLLERRFSLTDAQARGLSDAADRAATRAVELFHFTRIINGRLSPEERVGLIEMLWEVAYADGTLDKFEDTLLRRIGGLIDVPDRERGVARQRVLKRLGLDDTI